MSSLRGSNLLPLLLVLTAAAAACDDSSGAIKEPAAGAGTPNGAPPPGGTGSDAGPGAKDCFEDPKTHFEIINACTSATKIAKNPALPKLYPDGGLPPLK